MVAPRYAGTASGAVVATAGSTSACVIKLSKGRGSCALSASRLNPGTYHLIAHWPGNADFTPSASTPVTLTVIRPRSAGALLARQRQILSPTPLTPIGPSIYQF
jgi:Bacterial Ig-like domain (group 3)